MWLVVHCQLPLRSLVSAIGQHCQWVLREAVLHGVQTRAFVSQSMHEGSNGRGMAIESIHMGDGGSLSMRVLTALIDDCLSNGEIQRWGGGGFFRSRAFFPPAPRHPPYSVGW